MSERIVVAVERIITPNIDRVAVAENLLRHSRHELPLDYAPGMTAETEN